MPRLAQRTAIALFIATATAVATIATDSAAQELTFGNASLLGTYSFIRLDSRPGDEGNPSNAVVGLAYFDGHGNYRLAIMHDNKPDIDTEGNPIRVTQNTLSDPAGFFVFADEYEVRLDGTILTERPFFDPAVSTMDGFPTRVEIVDGVPTIVAFSNFSRLAEGGGLAVYEFSRIANDDLAPPMAE